MPEIKFYKKYYSAKDVAHIVMEESGDYETALRILKRFVKAPGANVCPREGKWILSLDYPKGTFCSECGFAWSEEIDAIKLEPVLSKIKTNFCPNCGAKMGNDSDAIAKD